MSLQFFAYKRHAVVARYTGRDQILDVPATYQGLPVTEILDGAFAGNTDIEGVYLPATLQSIGERAFENCYALRFAGFVPQREESVSPALLPPISRMPLKLQTIGIRAFAGTAIRNFESRSPILHLDEAVFEGCSQLQTFAFLGKEQLTLGKRILAESAIVRFLVPGVRIDTLPEYAFAYCKQLRNVLGEIYAIGERAFFHCEQLHHLELPTKPRRIGRQAFEGCTQLGDEWRPARRAKPETPLRDNEKPKEEDTEMSDYALFDEAPAEEAPVFTLEIDYRGAIPTPLPTKLRGIWGSGGDAFHFSIQAPSHLHCVGMKLPADHVRPLLPMMEYIVKKSMAVVLLGKQEGRAYAVYEILPYSNALLKDLPDEFFRQMILRLKRPTLSCDAEAAAPVFTMHTEPEYETFLEICGSRLPGFVVDAYRRNQEIIRRCQGKLIDDEAKHARRAQEILMNIEWQPTVLNIPTAGEVRRILDEEFYGLASVKRRIEEVVAQIRKSGRLPKSGILLHGPAGVGKTSIAKAIARIFGIPLIQVDLTAVGDNPEAIYGSPRIYANARPGLILESMYQNRSATGILLVNEIDKAGSEKSGRSSGDFLLSVLDKSGFRESFLEETIPTDHLFCIGTCNNLDISKPLRDRFLIIDIPAYTRQEKQAIFTGYALPAAAKAAGLRPEQLRFDNGAVELLVREYAVEPGARDLEQYAERFVGDCCLCSGEGNRLYTCEDVRALLGPGRAIHRHYAVQPGSVNAAFFHNGVARFFLLEAAVYPGSGKFRVLGPMTKIQEEYCEVAYWSARSAVSSSAFDFAGHDITVFVSQMIPEGARNYVGLACYAAICSRLLNTDLALQDICFIGGCTLHGSVLLDETDLTPLLQAMDERKIATVYAPMGTSRLVNAQFRSNSNITIVEAPDAKTLFSLAVAQSQQ